MTLPEHLGSEILGTGLTPKQWVELLSKREIDITERTLRADPHNAALLRFMFETAARIGQAVSVKPNDLEPEECKVWLKAQKGHDAMWVKVSKAMMAEMLALPKKLTRKLNGQIVLSESE